jgi:hypothetical protein
MLPRPQGSKDPRNTSELRYSPGFKLTASRSAPPNLTRAIMTEETDKTAVTPAAEETMPSEETANSMSRRPSNEPGTGE